MPLRSAVSTRLNDRRRPSFIVHIHLLILVLIADRLHISVAGIAVFVRLRTLVLLIHRISEPDAIPFCPDVLLESNRVDGRVGDAVALQDLTGDPYCLKQI